jgi:hypothetical protein
MSDIENLGTEEVKWSTEDELEWYKRREERLEQRIRDLEASMMSVLYPEDESNLVEHAKRELELAKLLTEEGDFYGGMLGEAVLELVRVFSKQGHSGMSAPITLATFAKVANFETLTDNDHSLYRDISEHWPTDSTAGPGPHLQDVRDSKWFSHDGGTTWYNVDDK